MSLKFAFCLSLALCCGLAVAKPLSKDAYYLEEANYDEDMSATGRYAGPPMDPYYFYYQMLLHHYLQQQKPKPTPSETQEPAPTPTDPAQVDPNIPAAPDAASLLQYLPPGFPQFAAAGPQMGRPSGFQPHFNPHNFYPYQPHHYYPHHPPSHEDSKPSKPSKPAKQSKNSSQEESEVCKKIMRWGILVCLKNKEMSD